MDAASAARDPWDGHLLLVSGSGPADRAGVAEWARRGLDRGDKLIYAADEEAGTLDDLVVDLAEHDVAAAAAADSEQLTVVDPERLYRPGAFDRLIGQAFDDGFPGVRTCGSPEAAADVATGAEFAHFERAAEQCWTERGVSSLCRYPPHRIAGPELDVATARHPTGVRDSYLVAQSPAAGQLVLRGEVDSTNHALLQSVVSTAVAGHADGALRIDLCGIGFLSVGAWRALVHATAVLREAGNEVRLAGVSSVGRRVLRLTGYDRHFVLQEKPEPGA